MPPHFIQLMLSPVEDTWEYAQGKTRQVTKSKAKLDTVLSDFGAFLTTYVSTVREIEIEFGMCK